MFGLLQACWGSQSWALELKGTVLNARKFHFSSSRRGFPFPVHYCEPCANFSSNFCLLSFPSAEAGSQGGAGPAFLPSLLVMISDSLPTFPCWSLEALVKPGFAREAAQPRVQSMRSPSWTASCLCDLRQVTVFLHFAASSAKGGSGWWKPSTS